MARTLKHTGWVTAVAVGLVVLGTRPLVARASDPAAPAKRPAPAPQVLYDDSLQVTFGVAPDARGRTVLSARSPRLQVSKTIEPDQTTLDLATPDGDRLRIVARPDSVTVERGRQTATLTLPAKARDFARMRKLLADSTAARTFRALSAAVGARRAEPFFDGIVTSGALIGVLDGDRRATDALKARFAARRGARVRQVVWQRTTQECWDQYARDAIPIYDEYRECTGRQRWYDLVDRANCDAIYTLRAELAFSWLVACNGGFFAQ